MTDIYTENATTSPNHGEQIELTNNEPDNAPASPAASPVDKNTPSRLAATWRDEWKVTAEERRLKSEASGQPSNTQLADILRPLIELIDERCSHSMRVYPLDRICGVFGDQVFADDDADPGCLMVRLPYDCSFHPAATKTVAAILFRTAADEKWTHHLVGEDYREDPCRGPLRFSLVKKAIWVSMLEIFVPALRLKVDAVTPDLAAAERQVHALLEYLRADAPEFGFVEEDYMLF